MGILQDDILRCHSFLNTSQMTAFGCRLTSQKANWLSAGYILCLEGVIYKRGCHCLQGICFPTFQVIKTLRVGINWI